MPVKAKNIKDLPLKNELDGSESLLVQDSNGTKQAPLEVIVDEIKQNSQEKIREIESELDQTNAQLSDISKQKLDKGKGIVSFIFDDNSISNQNLSTIFKEYGFAYSNACIVKGVVENSAANTPLNKLLINDIDNFNLLSHGYDSIKLDSNTVSNGVANFEIMASKQVLKKWGFNINGWVSPNNFMDSAFLELIKRHYKYAFIKGYSNINTYESMNNSQDVYNLYRFHIDNNGASLDDVKKCVTKTIEQGGLTCFYAHSISSSTTANYQINESKLRDILSFCKENFDNNKLLVLNADEAISRFFNIQLDNVELTRTDNISPSIELFDYQKAAGTVNAIREKSENLYHLTFPSDTVTQRCYLTKVIENVSIDSIEKRICELKIKVKSDNIINFKNRVRFTNVETGESKTVDALFTEISSKIYTDILSRHSCDMAIGEKMNIQIFYEISTDILNQDVHVWLKDSELKFLI